MLIQSRLLLALIVSTTFVGCTASKLEQIEHGAESVERHSKIIQDEARPR